jgi:hypothetical protein
VLGVQDGRSKGSEWVDCAGSFFRHERPLFYAFCARIIKQKFISADFSMAASEKIPGGTSRTGTSSTFKTVNPVAANVSK